MVWGELWCLAGPAGCQAMTDSSVSQDYLACNNASLCSYDVATLLELLFPLLCTSFRQRSSSPGLHPIIVQTSSRYSRAFMHRTRGVGGCGSVRTNGQRVIWKLICTWIGESQLRESGQTLHRFVTAQALGFKSGSIWKVKTLQK